jgi:hypothetical protein
MVEISGRAATLAAGCAKGGDFRVGGFGFRRGGDGRNGVAPAGGLALVVGSRGGSLSFFNGLGLFGNLFDFESLIEDALPCAGVLEAGEHGRGGRRVEFADGVEFAVGGVDETDEGGLFAVELAGVFGVDTHAVGDDHVYFGGGGR